MAQEPNHPHSKPPTPHPTRMQNFQRGSRRNSESLGISLSVITTWIINDIFQYTVPMEVMAAFYTTIGIIVARIRDAG